MIVACVNFFTVIIGGYDGCHVVARVLCVIAKWCYSGLSGC